jgi:transposase
LPILHKILKKTGISEILDSHLETHGNEKISPAETLILLSYNIALGRTPLYKVGDWVGSLDHRVIGGDNVDAHPMNDDRLGRSLVKLYDSNRASLMTEITLAYIKRFNIDLSQIHNDTTSVKAYGEIDGKTTSGLELKLGHSKDHRPDLEQIVFSLSISYDGGVPVHHKCYPGNRSDDTTHIETWNTLCKISPKRDFIYVADSKLCSREQLDHIVSNGGRAITVVPRSWHETSEFKEKLKDKMIKKTEILREKKNMNLALEYYSVFSGDYLTYDGQYRIHWIFSSQKKANDEKFREERLKKAEENLLKINASLNTRKFKERNNVEIAIKEILQKYHVEKMIDIHIGTTKEADCKQTTRGRPGPNTEYERTIYEILTLQWARNKKEISSHKKTDGIFALLSTDKSLGAKKVLLAHKYQPNLEKRFSQIKSIHNVAPLLFQGIERVESVMFVFYIGLVLQALVERTIRKAMKEQKIKKIEVYPEHRCSERPTANAIFELFERVSSYQIINKKKVIEEYRDNLDETQLMILGLLGISEKEYWGQK